MFSTRCHWLTYNQTSQDASGFIETKQNKKPRVSSNFYTNDFVWDVCNLKYLHCKVGTRVCLTQVIFTSINYTATWSLKYSDHYLILHFALGVPVILFLAHWSFEIFPSKISTAVFKHFLKSLPHNLRPDSQLKRPGFDPPCGCLHLSKKIFFSNFFKKLFQ